MLAECPSSRCTLIPIALLELAAIAGEVWDFRARELEEFWVVRVDAVRGGGAWLVAPRPYSSETEVSIGLRSHAGDWRRAQAEEPCAIRLHLGPSPNGTFARIETLQPELEIGRSFAPCAAGVLAWAERELELGLGMLEPASEVSLPG